MNEQTLFDTCWQTLIGGESLEAIFERYPDQRQELEPMLVAAGRLQAMRTVTTSPIFRDNARTRLLDRIGNVPQENTSYGQRLATWWNKLMVATTHPLTWPAWAGTALAMFIAVLFLASTTYAAQTTIPGDSLYPLKMMSEQIWLRVATDSPDVELTLAERRLQEAQLLQMHNRHGAVLETVARYRQALDNWTAHSTMARIQDQSRVQQRFLRQLQALKKLGQSAPVEQQAMLQEQHRAIEQLMHRFGPPLTPTPPRQPVSTPDPVRMQQTPSGTDHQGVPERWSSTPIGHQETTQHQAQPASLDKTATNTPSATLSSEKQDRKPTCQGYPVCPESSPTIKPDAGSQQSPRRTSTPNPGTTSPEHILTPQVQDMPTFEPTPTPEDPPTTHPSANTTPGHSDQGGDPRPTASPGSDGEQSGGGPPPPAGDAIGGRKGG